MNANGKVRQDSTSSQKSVDSLKQVPSISEEGGSALKYNPSLSASSAQYAPVDDRRGLSFDELTKTQSFYSCKGLFRLWEQHKILNHFEASLFGYRQYG